MPTAIDVSSVVGLTAVGIFTTQILLGLLLSVGYNPRRQFPRQTFFTFHNWLGYIRFATVVTSLILLLSSSAGFVCSTSWSRSGRRSRPCRRALGTSLYLVTFVVVTSSLAAATASG